MDNSNETDIKEVQIEKKSDSSVVLSNLIKYGAYLIIFFAIMYFIIHYFMK
jgi:hypothetical protein